jgi:hypothetical protein
MVKLVEKSGPVSGSGTCIPQRVFSGAGTPAQKSMMAHAKLCLST